jgi:hypothetical protein
MPPPARRSRCSAFSILRFSPSADLTESKLFYLLWPEWTIFTALAVAFVRADDLNARRSSVARRLTTACATRHAKEAQGWLGWAPC